MERLKELREAKAMSQRDLAKASGVAQATISLLENGERKVRPSTLRKLADALRVEPSVLVREQRQNTEIELKEKSLAELAELAESAETPEVRHLARSELLQRPMEEDPQDFIRDSDFAEWLHAGRGVMEWYVAGRGYMRTYPINAAGAELNEDLAIAKMKLTSGVEREIKESAQLASRTMQQLTDRMSQSIKEYLREYESLPTHYFEDPTAARRIGEIGAAIASAQRQDLKMLQEFLDVRRRAELALLQPDVDSPLKETETERSQ